MEDSPAPASFGRPLAVPPLPSASIYVSVVTTVTWFTYRGLSPHKITPTPGVHQVLHRTAKSAAPIVALLFAAGELERYAMVKKIKKQEKEQTL